MNDEIKVISEYNPAEIGRELQGAGAITSRASIITGSLSGMGNELLQSVYDRTVSSELKDLLANYFTARDVLHSFAMKQAQSANKAAQEKALAFITEQTGQKLPGKLTLSGEYGAPKSVQVEGVEFLHCHEDGRWSATLRVQPSPRSFTTMGIYQKPNSQEIVWESDIDF